MIVWAIIFFGMIGIVAIIIAIAIGIRNKNDNICFAMITSSIPIVIIWIILIVGYGNFYWKTVGQIGEYQYIQQRVKQYSLSCDKCINQDLKEEIKSFNKELERGKIYNKTIYDEWFADDFVNLDPLNYPSCPSECKIKEVQNDL